MRKLVRPLMAILLLCLAPLLWPGLSAAFAADAVLPPPADRTDQPAQAGFSALSNIREGMGGNPVDGLARHLPVSAAP